MRGASSQTVDRMLGVLVAVCASAVLVAIGARAGSSLSTLLRLTYSEASQGSSRSKKHKGRNHFRRQRKGRNSSEAAEGGTSDNSDSSPQDGEEDGDAYYAYAYGARSAALRRRTAEDGEGRLVMHGGSCHCGGLVFEVEASEHLVAIEGPSKVRYPFITVLAEHFRLTSDDSNGSLYLLKCRPPTGRDSTPKVSAHFFCRRCGVHVVHAPDFPHAAVANVNVHCIRPSTIKSLAVAFSRGGGVELPGMGNPVEGLYEVGRESSWSDAMRERVSVALQQQQQQQQTLGETSTTSSSNSRALSPRRRAAFFASVPSAERAAETPREGLRAHGGAARSSKGGITALGAGGAMGAPDVSTLRRNAEERERARQRAGSPNSSRHSSAAGGGGGGGGSGSSNRPAGNTWGDVLMHVMSLPSSSSSTQHRKAKAKARGAQGSGANGAGEAWGRATSDDVLRAEQRRAVALGGSGVDVNGVLPPRVGRSMSRRADGAGAVSGNAGREEVGGGEGVKGGLRRRRSFSVDSTPTPHAAVSSSGAQGVALDDNAEDATGGSPSSAGGAALKNGPKNGGQTGVGRGGPRANGVDYRSSRAGERERFITPPPAEGVSGGYAAALA